MRKAILSGITFSVFLVSVYGQSNNSLSGKLEERIQLLIDSLSIPGISVSLISGEEVVYRHSSGYSNLEHASLMTDTSLYRVWSVSKQFCAVSILKLMEEGQLDLDHPIGDYLDSIPDLWKEITIRNLMNQTGGIKDYLNDYPPGRKLMATPFEEILDSTSIPKFGPGEDWSYTNTGYWVLARIVESVSGISYQEYLKREFFEPASMRYTRKFDYQSVIPGRVSGYRVTEGIPTNSTRILDEGFMADGDAELLSNLEDLSRWTARLLTGNIISGESLELAWSSTLLDNGDPIDVSYLIFYDREASYGMGWFISQLDGHRIVWTPGAGRGFSTTILSLPDHNFSLVVLTNTRQFLVADRIARDLATVVLEKRE